MTVSQLCTAHLAAAEKGPILGKGGRPKKVLANNGINGKGAWRDNVFVERLWRSVKYERCICGSTIASARSRLLQRKAPTFDP